MLRRGAAALTLGLIAMVGPTALDASLVPSVADESDPGKVVLVLDSSGSMKEPSSGGETKIAAAKKALRRVVNRLPAEQSVGLRVFGSEVFSAKDPGACQDTKLIADVDTNNRQELLTAIAKYKPYGETPIGVALQEAGKDLGSKGNRNIILVSDGVPTCEPDPCVVARNLAKDGINLRIDVVGLDVNGAARDALRCIAEEGNGVYYDVSNSDEFAKSLIKITTRSARRYQATGQPVTGSAEPATAPEITAGVWRDETDGQDTRYYRIEREIPGSLITAAFTYRAPKSTLPSMKLLAPSGNQCDATGRATQSADQIDSIAVTADGLRLGDWDAAAPCSAGSLVLEIDYGVPAGESMELVVTETPPVAAWPSLPELAEDPAFGALPGGPTRSVQPGISFTDAAPVEPGRYKTNIVPGELLTFKVPADWGQQVSARAKFAGLSKRKADSFPSIVDIYIKMYSPGQIPVSTGLKYGDDSTSRGYFEQETAISTATAPISLRNLERGTQGRKGAYLAGDYTVAVFMGIPAGTKPTDVPSVQVPITMDINVTGKPQPAPDFLDPSSGPTDQTGEPPAEPAGDQNASGNAPNEGTSLPGLLKWAVILAGLGAIGAAGIGAAILALRRRKSSTS